MRSLVKVWSLREIETPNGTTDPVVLDSTAEARAVLIGFEPGQQLREHQVKERSWLAVLDGTLEVRSDRRVVEAGSGSLLEFDPGEHRTVRSPGGARVLMFLAPWPGEGHYRGGGADAPSA